MPQKSPDAFRTISEVADWLGVQPHVLRFWESKFSQVKPVKRAGGRRYFRPNDMLLLGGIQQLLHVDGLTIKGAQKILREKGAQHVSAMSKPFDAELNPALAEEEHAADLLADSPEPAQEADTAPALPDLCSEDPQDSEQDALQGAARAIDIPDPDEASFELRPSVLTHIGRSIAVKAQTTGVSSDLIPLIGQLAALRDRLSTDRA
jgi:DNA-binding transcriptional MerR regulator